MFRFFEAFRLVRRNCIDFKTIPPELIKPAEWDHSDRRVRPQFCTYPSVGVFIPCFNEDPDLVLETVLGAVNLDYPSELLDIYLCDDGRDPLKRAMISQLRRQHRNLHYVVRPVHHHAKAGNLNYSIRRTSTDLVATLDADFVARPNVLQRLLPYYYLWNQSLGMYEFNHTLAVVQTPQYYRNLSPYDSDPLDQRSTFFFDLVLPGKDWFNASTMIGTTNLLSRSALQHAGFYPYHSITEDTAMSLMFHSLKYRTFFVNESLATGLATASLWANLRQRARWLKGDWQILFSKHGPLTAPNLTLIQRILYLHMTFSRFISIVHLFYDLCAVVLLVAGIPPLDAPDAKLFIFYIGAFLGMSIVARAVVTFGGQGLAKSESGAVVFEVIFRYTILKGLFATLFKGQNLDFKVTEKAKVKKKESPTPKQFSPNDPDTVLGTTSTQRQNSNGDEIQRNADRDTSDISPVVSSNTDTPSYSSAQTATDDEIESSSMGRTSAGVSDGQSTLSTGRGDDSAGSVVSHDEYGRLAKKRFREKNRTAEEKAERKMDILKNLKRIWFNILFAVLLSFSITWGIINPPVVAERGESVVQDGELGTYRYNNIVPLALALGFAMANLLPHLLAIYLCFIPYVSGWMMTDLVHGRCDQFAVHPKTGKLFVPWSFISMITVAKFLLIFGAMAALGAFSFGSNEATFQVNV